MLLAKNKQINKNVFKSEDEISSVSILIAAYNEQFVIKEKITSIINSDFPTDKIEIIIASDCSTDNTNQIISELAEEFPFIKTYFLNKRTGKAGVVNKLVGFAKNKILILTDANIIFSDTTIFNLVKHFKNDKIGLVDSNMVNIGIKKSGISLQEKTYISTEVNFKHAESKIWGKLMGPFGGCFAIRKSLFSPIPENFLVDDFFVCMNILKEDFFSINDLDAVVFEDVSNELSEEFRRKRRISKGNFINLFHFKKLLNPFKQLGFIFISHKILRWFAPIFLIMVFVSNYTLIGKNIFYQLAFDLQISLIILPFIDYILRKIGIHILVLRFITHFYSMNLAMLFGMFDYFFSSETGLWEPTKRKQK
jgi:cellulose synthase/poly-beta-1,6-N-acetylglucosamine synthase-like glycosyltransferase